VIPRRARDRIFRALTWGLAIIAAAPIVAIVAQILVVGYSALARLGPQALVAEPPAPGDETGGFGPQLLGTLEMGAIAVLLGSAIGIPVGIYIGEHRRGALPRATHVAMSLLVEYPTIVIGLLVYSFFTYALPAINTAYAPVANALRILGIEVSTEVSPFSGFAGALALALVVTPYIAIVTASAYSSIPSELREAAYAIAPSKFDATMVILRRVASRALLVALLLSVAKALGETAPLIVTALGNDYCTSPTICVDLSQPTGSVTLLIYYMAQSPYEAQRTVAWASAAVLTTIILIIYAIIHTRLSRD